MNIRTDFGRLPVYIWADEIPEDDALIKTRQIANVADLPFAVGHIALMADTHFGNGLPIGCVMAARGAVVPNAVGTDIGCGMQAVRLNVKADKVQEKINEITHEITRAIPRGRYGHKNMEDHSLFDELPDIFPVKKQLKNMRFQLGTLGGGNHFIEVQRDEEGFSWLMLHSGSRNLGAQLHKYYNDIARKENPFNIAEDVRLCALATESEAGQEYLAAMEFALKYAKTNRSLMMQRMLNIVSGYFDTGKVKPFDTCHNFAALEILNGEEVLMHRKGAVKADSLLILPGAMGRNSYICEGLNNPLAHHSCSHGAGRAMSRGAATRAFTPDSVKAEVNGLGIVLKAEWKTLPEEAPGAYKDIERVLELQGDLARAIHKLTAMAVIKD